MGKYCSNTQCFKEKNYKAKFSTSSILKNKSIKIILKKKKKKKQKKEDNFGEKNEKQWEKKHVGKVKAKFSTSLILEKNQQR